MELQDLRMNVQKAKGALDYYEELLASKITDKEIAKQRLLIVKNEILGLAMKTEKIAKQLEDQIKK
jgi:catechol-2,3-dioxygenase